MPHVTANGIELYYEEAGEGVPLVLQAHHHMPWMPLQVLCFSQVSADKR